MSRFNDERLDTFLACLVAGFGMAGGWANAYAAEEMPAQQATEADLAQLSLEQLSSVEVGTVYGASKHLQSTLKAPASVSIVTSDEIRKFGYRTLGEALNSVRGIYTTADRGYSYLGVRGFNRPGDYNGRVLVLVDGVRVNDSVYQTGPTGNDFPVDIDLVDRVEVIRGPGSSLYGSSAFLGVVNVVTKQGDAIKGVEASGAYGSFNAVTGRLTYGNRFKSGVDVMISATGYTSDGLEGESLGRYYEGVTDLGPNAPETDFEHGQKYLAKVSYGGFTLSGALGMRAKGLPTASYGTVYNDSRNRIDDDLGWVDLTFDREFAGDWHFLARVNYNSYASEGHYVYDVTEPGGPYATSINFDTAQSQRWGTEFQLSKLIADKHRLMVGGEFRHNFDVEQRSWYEDPPEVVLDDQRNTWEAGAFVAAELELHPKVVLNLGGRYDYYETFGESINPRAALVWNYTTNSAAKLIYGTAFRAPNAYEFYYYDGLTTMPNPGLAPETISTYELVLEQKLSEPLTASLGGFYYCVEDLISPVPNVVGDMSQFQNADSTEALGGEAELQGRWKSGLLARISYSLQEVEDQETGGQLSNSPLHLAKAAVSVPVWHDKIFASLEVLAMSRRKTTAGNYEDAYGILNLTLYSRNLVKNLEFSASIYNLLDTQYGDPGRGISESPQEVLYRDGRTFQVKLTYRF